MHIETKRVEETRINLIVTQTIRHDTSDYDIYTIVECFKAHLLRQRKLLQEEILDKKAHVLFDR